MKLSETINDTASQDDLEYDQYLFDLFLSDHIENQVQRMMEYCSDNHHNCKNTPPVLTPNQ